MAIPNERVLDELDQQETHLKRLCRRVDAMSEADTSVELQMADLLHRALRGALQPMGDTPNAVRQMTAVWLRSDAQRDCADRLARHVEELGGPISAEAVARELRRGYERMPSILNRHLLDRPTDLMLKPADELDDEYFDLAFNTMQEQLLRIDEAIGILECQSGGS